MLSEKMQKRLNEQVNLEFYSANLYLQMSAWCRAEGLEGCAAFLRDHSTEEREHMERLFDYINECGGLAEIGELKAPGKSYKDVWKVFEQTYEHEKMITGKINELVDMALSEKDHATFNFLQWYVSEQHEEENLFKGIIDKMHLIGEKGNALYHFDREVGRLAGASSSDD